NSPHAEYPVCRLYIITVPRIPIFTNSSASMADQDKSEFFGVLKFDRCSACIIKNFTDCNTKTSQPVLPVEQCLPSRHQQTNCCYGIRTLMCAAYIWNLKKCQVVACGSRRVAVEYMVHPRITLIDRDFDSPQSQDFSVKLVIFF